MANSKKHFYTIVKGRVPGVYTQWSGAGGAEEQVKGFPGAVFKGFATRAEAETYLRSGGKDLPSAPNPHPQLESMPAPAPKPVGKPSSAYQDELNAGKVIIFTDGASTGNPGPGGYGAVLLFDKGRKELSAGFSCTTNNRMELLACIMALRELNRPAPVIIFSDSRYVVNAVEKGWAKRWRKNGWMRLPDEAGRPQRAENSDLWEEMLGLLERQPVEFRWVKGHASNPENERCDQLAVQAAHGRNLPPDSGYKGTCR
jgi:ribonuclease HI